MRPLCAPRVVMPILAWALVLAVLPPAASAAPLPPGATGDATVDPRTLEWRLAAARLVALGVSPAEAATRLAALSDGERRELAARLDELGVGASAPAAAILAVAIIVGLLVVLVLELLGRRVISRPAQ